MKRSTCRQSRRQFLAAGGAGLAFLRPAAAAGPPPLFEEIPPEGKRVKTNLARTLLGERE